MRLYKEYVEEKRYGTARVVDFTNETSISIKSILFTLAGQGTAVLTVFLGENTTEDLSTALTKIPLWGTIDALNINLSGSIKVKDALPLLKEFTDIPKIKLLQACQMNKTIFDIETWV